LFPNIAEEEGEQGTSGECEWCASSPLSFWLW
jgi:hypothetical protein